MIEHYYVYGYPIITCYYRYYLQWVVESELGNITIISGLKVKFTPIPSTHSESFKKSFTGYKDGLVRSDPGGFVMTPLYRQNADKINKIEPRKSDDVALPPHLSQSWYLTETFILLNS